jgi:hypothetical protein
MYRSGTDAAVASSSKCHDVQHFIVQAAETYFFQRIGSLMILMKLVRATLFGVLLIFAGSAMAANFTARISSLLFYEQGGLIYIYVDGGTQERPACAGSNGDYLSFSMSRPRAKEYLSGLMFAYGSGRPVRFQTEGACVDQTVSDTLRYFAIVNG